MSKKYEKNKTNMCKYLKKNITKNYIMNNRLYKSDPLSTS